MGKNEVRRKNDKRLKEDSNTRGNCALDHSPQPLGRKNFHINTGISSFTYTTGKFGHFAQNPMGACYSYAKSALWYGAFIS